MAVHMNDNGTWKNIVPYVPNDFDGNHHWVGLRGQFVKESGVWKEVFSFDYLDSFEYWKENAADDWWMPKGWVRVRDDDNTTEDAMSEYTSWATKGLRSFLISAIGWGTQRVKRYFSLSDSNFSYLHIDAYAEENKRDPQNVYFRLIDSWDNTLAEDIWVPESTGEEKTMTLDISEIDLSAQATFVFLRVDYAIFDGSGNNIAFDYLRGE